MTVLLAAGTVVDLYPLHIGAEEDGFCEVGRPDTGTFVALPPEGVALVGWLAQGLSVGEVRERFLTRYGLPPELEDFLDGISECGFVRQITAASDPGAALPRPAPAAGPTARGILLLVNVSQDQVRWLLSRPMVAVYAGLWLAVPLLLVTDPRLAPRPGDAIVTSDVLLNAILLTLIATALVLAHELAHALAARAVGCAGRLSVSRRLWFLVGQTELADVRTVPRRRRYAPYLAGMTWDLAVLLGCLVAEVVTGAGESPGIRLARVIVYTLCLTMIYQFSVFMRTDVYYVAANWLRLGDPMGDTRRYIRNVAAKIIRKPVRYDLGAVPARELKVIRWYAVYYLAGSAAATIGVFLLSVPAVVRMVRIAVDGIHTGPANPRAWEGIGFLALVAIQFGTLALVGYLDWSRGRRWSQSGA